MELHSSRSLKKSKLYAGSMMRETTEKLGVSAYDYISDRVSKSFKMPSLAELIGAKKSLTFDCKDNF
jgi:hypothetical protein